MRQHGSKSETHSEPADKRILVLESELALILQNMKRDGNTISAVLRQAWDADTLEIFSKNSPARATGAHISVIGHITIHELQRHMSETELASGLANRFLWPCVNRSKALPEGGRISDELLEPLVAKLKNAVRFASEPRTLTRDAEARSLWHQAYAELSAGKSGLLGAVISRAEAQVMRFASIYALLDCSDTIQKVHLQAALELWRYAEQSARLIFGDKLGDPAADEVLAYLKAAKHAGLTRTEISSQVFGRHRKSPDIARVLTLLASEGHAYVCHEKTEGRPIDRWFAVGYGPKSQA